ncbi:MAG: glycoside hydrolase family 2 protein [Ruminococcaceae bacterium]|nr:glycoside hydrolase family 2 protein [Oscillospiraceae bacterium]
MNRLNPNILCFNTGWKFHPGVPSSGEPRRHFWKAGYASGPAARVYNDSAWRIVNLPHDWGMELDHDYTVDVQHGAAPIANGVDPQPIGFYRKSFDVPADWENLRATLVFDGIYRDCDLWVNGQYVTNNVAGYTGFSVDITDLLFYGEVNNITVRVDASHREGWFYEGAGIYRNVWLRLLPQVSIDPDSVFVRLGAHEKQILCSFTVRNDSDNDVTDTAAVDIAGLHAEQSVFVPAWECSTVSFTLEADELTLWDTENPFLYTFTVSCGAHEYKSRTGFRTVRFDPNHGFFLNGKSVKILGSCTHQDFAVVGSALDDDVQRYKMGILKKYGFNGSRTAHNPPAPEVLEACDEIGLLVMSEARLYGSTPEAMRQLDWLILSGRNHPSVVIWSIGNEEIIQLSDSSARQALTVQRRIRKLDPTRAITYAGNNADHLEGINSVVEVRGVNYINMLQDPRVIDEYHAKRPWQPVIGSEESSYVGTRGIYEQVPEKGYIEDLDNVGPRYMLGAEALWKVYCAREYLAGVYVWTGIEYRGEASKQAYITPFGFIDICGFPKAGAMYCQAAAAKEPVMWLCPHWNRNLEDGSPAMVRIYTNADEVELFVNGESCGRRVRKPLSSIEYEVPYHPGTVECIGYRDGAEYVRRSMTTAGEPVRLAASSERVGETAFVTIEALDADGNPCPEASNRLHFMADGACIMGASNGNPCDEDPELCMDRWETLPLRGFRVHENPGYYQFSDQNLSGIVGNTDAERFFCHAASYIPENDDVFHPELGPRRKVVQNRSEPSRQLRISCEFWLDSADLDYETIRVGYCDGKAKLILNHTVLFEGNGDGDAIEAALKGALRRGLNRLEIEVDNTVTYVCAVGHGVELRKPLKRTFSRRLFNNRCLCIVKAPDGGTLQIGSDGMDTVSVAL